MCCLTLVGTAWAGPLEKGTKAYERGDYKKAQQYYLEAQSKEGLNPTAHYNLGTALFRQKKYKDAVASFKQALNGADSLVSRNSYYNMGNSQFRAGEGLQKPKEKIGAYKEAIASYKKSLEWEGGYEKSKRNIEFVQIKLKEEIDKQKEQQKNQDNQDQNKEDKPPMSDYAKKMLARAMQLAQQELYQDAKGVLEKVMEEDETAETFSTYIQRIQDIIDINAGKKPQAPIDNSNVDNELEVI